jgi:integrase
MADALRMFIGGRSDGFIFRNAEQKSIHQSNFLRHYLHPILKKLGIEKQDFHGFRRFRVTHLESSAVPAALVRYWTGHARSADVAVVQQTVTDQYVKMSKGTQFRAEVAERIGIGFELPNPVVVPAVPSKVGSEVSVNI